MTCPFLDTGIEPSHLAPLASSTTLEETHIIDVRAPPSTQNVARDESIRRQNHRRFTLVDMRSTLTSPENLLHGQQSPIRSVFLYAMTIATKCYFV